MKIEEAKVGMEVLFGRPNGEQTRGKIVRISGKTATVETLGDRGRGRGACAGARWRVGWSLLRHATGEPIVQAPVRQRPEHEILQEYRHVQCQLSPENLYCDGEISRAQARIKERRLMVRLAELEAELGRQPSDVEIYSR